MAATRRIRRDRPARRHEPRTEHDSTTPSGTHVPDVLSGLIRAEAEK
ncbi:MULTISPECIES: hypothetical protein [Streptomyces]|uniref:Uncharacterized protein n=1 Tax=Streptomyces bacillaris TaxID=68179 RepID=A0ABW6DUD7_9ACTN|nr:hypothetical protein [Streptomyces nanshensis]